MPRKKQQGNWRLKPETIKLLKETAKRSGLTQTQVVAACIAKHAVSIPGLADDARNALLEVVTRELGANQSKD